MRVAFDVSPLAQTGAGIHVKTAGTTWLEEIIGLAESGGAGLQMAKEIYAEALDHIDELCAPYATVIDIDRSQLPPKAEVESWSSEQYANALRHNAKRAEYNLHVRQLLHVGYKIAAHKSERYLGCVRHYRDDIARGVTHNLFERHVKPIFLGE